MAVKSVARMFEKIVRKGGSHKSAPFAGMQLVIKFDVFMRVVALGRIPRPVFHCRDRSEVGKLKLLQVGHSSCECCEHPAIEKIARRLEQEKNHRNKTYLIKKKQEKNLENKFSCGKLIIFIIHQLKLHYVKNFRLYYRLD